MPQKVNFKVKATKISVDKAIAKDLENLEPFAGKPLFIMYFSATCGHCAHAAPEVLEMAKEFAPKGLITLAVASGGNQKVGIRKFMDNAITEYQDYRCYMQDFYNEKKRLSAFSWREFAHAAGFSSPTYLKLVCEGKTRLSPAGATNVGVAMNLAGFELEYFVRMVDYGHAKTDQEKKIAYESMLELAKNCKAKIVDGWNLNALWMPRRRRR